MSTGTVMLPRPGILDIKPYEGGESAIEGRADVIKLSSNEGALGPSPKAVEAFKANAGRLSRYPDGACGALRAAIGDRFGLDPQRIVCGAGSDELLGLLARAYAGEGDEVMYSAHGFLMYPIAARAAGAHPVAVAEQALTADVDALINAAGNRTRILYLANPNNPTGSYLSGDDLCRLRAGLPDDVLLVVDSAYAEFVTAADYEAGQDLVDANDNVVMTRTFSKIFGLGGLRLGWAYGPAHVIDVLNRIRMPFNVSAPAQAAGVAALADTAHTEKAATLNTRLRSELVAALEAAGITVAPSAANFVLARFIDSAAADAAETFLRERAILVRRMGAYGLPESLRITIGLEHEIAAVAGALGDFMKGNGHGG